MEKKLQKVKNAIIDVHDFPIKGIVFKDITPIFKEPELVNTIIDAFIENIDMSKIDVIAGAESRGFLFGVPLALKTNKPFVLIRKQNKLPRKVYTEEYDLEYGKASFQLQVDDIKQNQNVLIVDDLLATGGTVQAIEKLIRKAGANPINSVYVIELEFLKGRERLTSKPFSLFKYEK